MPEVAAPTPQRVSQTLGNIRVIDD